MIVGKHDDCRLMVFSKKVLPLLSEMCIGCCKYCWEQLLYLAFLLLNYLTLTLFKSFHLEFPWFRTTGLESESRMCESLQPSTGHFNQLGLYSCFITYCTLVYVCLLFYNLFHHPSALVNVIITFFYYHSMLVNVVLLFCNSIAPKLYI